MKNHAVRALAMLVAISSAAGCKGKSKNESHVSIEKAPAPADAHAATESLAQSGIATSTLAVAIANAGDSLECVQTSAAVAKGSKAPAETLALAILDDVSAIPNGAVLQKANGKDRLTRALGAFVTGDYTLFSKQPMTPEEGEAMLKSMLAEITWPPEKMAAGVESGNIAKVDSCLVPGRTAVQLCHVEARATSVGWSLDYVFFDVRQPGDSDVRSKVCGEIGGEWTVSDNDHPDAAMEQMRQRAGQLRDLLGSP